MVLSEEARHKGPVLYGSMYMKCLQRTNLKKQKADYLVLRGWGGGSGRSALGRDERLLTATGFLWGVMKMS